MFNSNLLPKTKKKIKRRKEEKAIAGSFKELTDFVTIRDGFIKAIKKYGANERGESVRLPGWYVELLSAIADFRIGVTYTTGCSQLGKTLGHTNLVCYCMEQLELNPLWAYDLQASLNIQVPSNFRPVAEAWLEKAGKPGSKGAKNNTIYQVGTATTQFTYVSTSDANRDKQGKAAAGGIAVGVSRDILFKEERSQYPLGAADPLRRRLDAGRIPTKPERELGTPGGGAGIEAEIDLADCYFYPHFECQECGKRAPLHPKGSLLKKFQLEHPILGKKEVYLSESGRPVKWFCHNENDPINTAYFGCPHCEAEITTEAREKAWYQCLYTGITLKEYLNQLPSNQLPTKRHKIGICISPLLRIEAVNTAAEIIEEGLTTFNTADWQQQRLGLPSEQGTNRITLELLKSAIASPVPDRKPDVSIGGIDAGRAEHWLWKMNCYLPENAGDLKIEQIMEQTIREVTFADGVTKTSLEEMVADLDYGLVDNEPDRDWATYFIGRNNFEMANQKPGLRDAARKVMVIDGGIESPCWDIRNEKFLKSVLNGFVLALNSYSLYRLPASWDRYLSTLKSDRNPLKHLMAVSFAPNTGKWERPINHVDDIYFAAMFAEAAFYLWLTEQWNIDDGISIGVLQEVRSRDVSRRSSNPYFYV